MLRRILGGGGMDAGHVVGIAEGDADGLGKRAAILSREIVLP